MTVNGAVVSGSTTMNSPVAIIDSGTTQLVLTSSGLTGLVNALISSGAVTFNGVPQSEQNGFWAGETTILSSYITLDTSVTITIDFQGTDGSTASIPIPITNLCPTDSASNMVGFMVCESAHLTL